MRFKSYRLQLVLRLLLLAATLYFFCSFNFNPGYRGTLIFLGLLAVLQVLLLIRYHENTSRQISRFLNAVKFDDFTEQFQASGENGVRQYLARQLNEVMEKFREVRAEKEAQLQYFEAIVQHIGTGIVTFKPDGTVLLLNTAAKKLLQVAQLKTLTDLQTINPALAETLQQVEHGGKALVQHRQNGQLVNLSVHVIGLQLLGAEVRIASLQNIQPELEEKEMEAWQNLIKVLTHEIMNSVTPVASLSASAYEEVSSYTDTSAEEITLLKEELADIGQCLQTISRRSDGLIRFLSDFRSLSSYTRPQVSLFDAAGLLREVSVLYREQLAEQQVELVLDIRQEPLLLSADRAMVEQVVINLLKNAMEAVAGQAEKRISLKAFPDERSSRVCIEVSDTGTGMTPEAQAKIFIPFYTTKPSGSGIGLSLSRQIMRAHNGVLTVSSELGSGTSFTLRF